MNSYELHQEKCKLALSFISILSFALIVSFGCTDESLQLNNHAVSTPETQSVGVLMDFTDQLREYNEEVVAALEMAVDEGVDINLDIYNAALNIDSLKNALRIFAMKEYPVVITTASDSGLVELIPIAREENILLVGVRSEGACLEIRDDPLIRFVPDEALQMEALAAIAAEMGYDGMLPIRNEESTYDDRISLLKHRVSWKNIPFWASFYLNDGYSIRRSDYQLWRFFAETNPQTFNPFLFIDLGGETVNTIDVYSLNRLLGYFYPYFDDSYSENPTLGPSSMPHDFMFFEEMDEPSDTMLLDLTYGWIEFQPPSNNDLLYIQEEILERTGRICNPYALCSYDALKIIEKAAEYLDDLSMDWNKWEEAIRNASTDYRGITGPCDLSCTGDRLYSRFVLKGFGQGDYPPDYMSFGPYYYKYDRIAMCVFNNDNPAGEVEVFYDVYLKE